jgi:hypothetical protein
MHRRLSQTFQLRIASSVTFLTFKTLVFDILHSTLPLFATRHCGCFRPCLPKQATIRLWTTASFRWKLYPKIMFKCTAHTHTHTFPTGFRWIRQQIAFWSCVNSASSSPTQLCKGALNRALNQHTFYSKRLNQNATHTDAARSAWKYKELWVFVRISYVRLTKNSHFAYSLNDAGSKQETHLFPWQPYT